METEGRKVFAQPNAESYEQSDRCEIEPQVRDVAEIVGLTILPKQAPELSLSILWYKGITG